MVDVHGLDTLMLVVEIIGCVELPIVLDRHALVEEGESIGTSWGYTAFATHLSLDIFWHIFIRLECALCPCQGRVVIHPRSALSLYLESTSH